MFRINRYTKGETSVYGEFDGGKMHLTLNTLKNIPGTGTYHFTKEELEKLSSLTGDYLTAMVELMESVNERILKLPELE